MFAPSDRIVAMTGLWRVTTWNLHGSADPPLARAADVVRHLHPDVLVLQEVRRAQCRRLARQLGWRHTWHRKHHPYSPFVWWRTEGLAIVSPHRITDASSQSLTPQVSTWTYRHRIAVSATVTRRDETAVRVVDLHLASDTTGGVERVDQATAVRRMLDSTELPTVIAGDLNDHGDPAVVETLAGSTHTEAWQAATERSAGDGATNPSHAPHQRLDHVLVPSTAAEITAEVPRGGTTWAEISDHLPLTVQFDLSVEAP
jgi:endonuclease/exonuclease/phosphatase family metal-dependent hydrolase